jgi:hypothetical protein
MYNSRVNQANTNAANLTPSPIKVVSEDIPALEVAKYYLEVEFLKLFKDSSQDIAKTIYF